MPLERLHPNTGQIEGLPKNPRFIRDQKFNKLVQSIKDDPEMLEMREILAYETDDSRGCVIIGGNMRYEALKFLKYESAPCKILPKEFPIDKLRRIVLKDNSSFGETDWDALINEWSPDEIDAAAIDVPDIAEPKSDEEQQAEDDNFDVEANTPKKATSQPGDIYELGEHRLICGDSTKAETVAALMNGAQADLLITDPPYNVDYGNVNKAKIKISAKRYKGANTNDIANDKMDESCFVQFLTSSLQNANDVLKKGGAFYIWHGTTQNYEFQTAMHNVGWKLRQIIIWNKSSLCLGLSDYQWKHEPCLYGWKDGAGHYFIDKRNLTTVIEDQPDIESMSKQDMKELLQNIFLGELPTTVIDCAKPKANHDHPTMKPVPLIGKLVNNSSRTGDIVLDIFGGSGTTLIASEQLHRRCRMVEYEPIYCDVIIKRWQELTGCKARLVCNMSDRKEE